MRTLQFSKSQLGDILKILEKLHNACYKVSIDDSGIQPVVIFEYIPTNTWIQRLISKYLFEREDSKESKKSLLQITFSTPFQKN